MNSAALTVVRKYCLVDKATTVTGEAVSQPAVDSLDRDGTSEGQINSRLTNIKHNTYLTI